MKSSHLYRLTYSPPPPQFKVEFLLDATLFVMRGGVGCGGGGGGGGPSSSLKKDALVLYYTM